MVDVRRRRLVYGKRSPTEVQEAEERVGLLPPEYRSFVMTCGAAQIHHHDVLGLVGESESSMDVIGATEWERVHSDRSLPGNLIAVLNDGGGNIYAVATDGSVDEADRHAVFAWWHDDDSDPEVMASSFTEWLRELLRA